MVYLGMKPLQSGVAATITDLMMVLVPGLVPSGLGAGLAGETIAYYWKPSSH